jgi:phage terminase small subunit
MSLTNKQQAFVNEYLRDFNATQAAIRCGYSAKTARSIGSALLTKLDIQAEISAQVSERGMGKDEVFLALTDQARGDLGSFFKIVEEWTFYPLPSYEVIGEKEVIDDTDPENPVTRISYWVRHVCIDTDKLVDPRYSHLLHKFSDSPKNGLGIELYNKQAALQTLAKIHGMMIDKTEITGKDGEPLNKPDDDERFNRAISTLADAIRESISGPDAQPKGALDAPEQAAMDGAPLSGR